MRHVRAKRCTSARIILESENYLKLNHFNVCKSISTPYPAFGSIRRESHLHLVQNPNYRSRNRYARLLAPSCLCSRNISWGEARRRATVNDEGGVTESAGGGAATGDSDRNRRKGGRDDGALRFVGTLLRYAVRYRAVKFILPVSCH